MFQQLPWLENLALCLVSKIDQQNVSEAKYPNKLKTQYFDHSQKHIIKYFALTPFENQIHQVFLENFSILSNNRRIKLEFLTPQKILSIESDPKYIISENMAAKLNVCLVLSITRYYALLDPDDHHYIYQRSSGGD